MLPDKASIVSWAAAAGATIYAYPKLLPQAKQYFTSDLVATGAVVGGVFLGTLIVVSIFTIKISDMVLDSRVGALDRTLGFLFGLAAYGFWVGRNRISLAKDCGACVTIIATAWAISSACNIFSGFFPVCGPNSV